MTLNDGRVPEAAFKMRVRDEHVEGDNPYRWQEVTSREIFRGRRVIVFAMPGAFTPTCSSTHLPRYEELYDDFKAAGIDEIYCLAVNDAFVMFQWAKHVGASKVRMLPDGNAEFTRKMGMLVDKKNLGFGQRSWRYAMVINDGEIEKAFVEPGFEDNCATDPFEISDADTVLAWIRGTQAPTSMPARSAFVG